MTKLELYITNTETIYPDYNDPFSDVAVRLYGRTPDGVAKQVTVTGFQPYFYALADEQDTLAPAEHDDLEGYESTDVVALEERFHHLTPGLDARELVRVVVSYPGAIPKVKDYFDITWDADVRFTNRFRIDKDIRSGVSIELEPKEIGEDHIIVDESRVEAAKLEDIEERWCVFDIETDDRDTGFPDPGEARILSIVAYDNYDDEYVGFVDLDDENLESRFGLGGAEPTLSELGLEEVDKLKFERNERRMLIAFASYIADRDPDLISGWNSGDTNADGFDLPHLVERMDEVGASPERMARRGLGVGVDNYNDEWKVQIGGRTTYDLMDAWASTKFTEPDSKRLDDVAQDALDDAKIEHPDQGYFEMYRDDLTKFLNYNGKDTRLTVEIARQEDVFAFKKRLKVMIGVDWEEVRENNDFVSMSVRRKCREHGLAMVTARDNPRVREAAGNKDDEVNYEGAYVFPAFNGVKRNVVGVDLASLYPMTQWMLNASPDTKIDRKLAFKHDIDHVVAANGAAFRTDVDSIIRELVDEYDEIKMNYKRRRNAETAGSDAWETAALFYGVAKTIYNSYYGYTGWDKSPIYDPEIAAAVTLTGQDVIKRTAEYIAEHSEGEVAYGDTDSNYVEFPSGWTQEQTLEEAAALCETLTSSVYPEMCGDYMIDPADNRWEIELEMRAERFFQSGSKKFYAYLKTWDEGMDFDEQLKGGDGKFSVAGYQCVKSSTAKATKEMQRDVLETIVRGGSKEDVTEIVFGAASNIDAQDPDWEAMGMPQGLGKKIPVGPNDSDDYYSWSKTRDTPQNAHPRGAWFANHLLDVDYGKGSKPKRAYLKETLLVEEEPVDVICYENQRDLEPIKDNLQMDVPVMQEKVLLNPMDDILHAFGLEPEAAIQGNAQTQSSMEAFI